MNIFERTYQMIMEDVNTERSSIKKVDAMTPHEFVDFLREFLPYIKDGIVDIDKVRISEKIDGQAFKIAWLKGEMLFESSYSGLGSWKSNEFPQKAIGKFLEKHFKSLFKTIATNPVDGIGSDFKIVGEMIWIDPDDPASEDYVTPVCASYLKKEFGQFGGMVVFDILKYDEATDSWVNFPKEEYDRIYTMISDLSCDEFVFKMIGEIDLTKNVKFDLDINQLEEFINQPGLEEILKNKYDKKKPLPVFEPIFQVQKQVVDALSDSIKTIQGAYSKKGEMIEGIVVKILSSGNQYGMFSNGYREVKKPYWATFEKLKHIYEDFFKEIYGVLPMSKKRSLVNNGKIEKYHDEYEAKYNEIYDGYVSKLRDAYQAIIDDPTIPAACRRVQLSMARGMSTELSYCKDYDDFVERFVTGNKVKDTVLEVLESLKGKRWKYDYKEDGEEEQKIIDQLAEDL